jgi:mannose-1-phosphate guanylyltransferase
MTPTRDHSERAAVILAGGDGIRLGSFIQKIFGRHIPKQFCPLFEGVTLLEQTLRRTALLVPPAQTITIVKRTHERFYAPLVCGNAPGNILAQPENRGTAAAILYALISLVETGFTGTVAICPSDHYVNDDSLFMDHVSVAFLAVEVCPRLIVLLGIKPDRPETEYGWIEPDGNVIATYPGFGPISSVRQFWEKPSPAVAHDLYDRGYLWNSFILVANAETLLVLIARALPRLYQLFARLRSAIGAIREEEVLREVYRDIAPADFSSQVLARFPNEFAVLPVAGVSWSDLGDPKRLLALLPGRDIESARGEAIVCPTGTHESHLGSVKIAPVQHHATPRAPSFQNSSRKA